MYPSSSFDATRSLSPLRHPGNQCHSCTGLRWSVSSFRRRRTNERSFGIGRRAALTATLLRGGTGNADRSPEVSNEQPQGSGASLLKHLSPMIDLAKLTAPKPNVSETRGWKTVSSIICAFLGIQRVGTALETNRLMGLGSIYAWSLIGSSVGFYLFLYFISVGYALGICLPVTVTMLSYLRYRDVSTAALLHSSLVILWSLRLATFLLWREYKNWPALHAKIVRVNEERTFAWHQKLACWLVYSFLYVCLLTPCWFRLEESTSGNGLSPGTRLGISLQACGLFVEALADYQKSTFKARNRLYWCRSGLWRFSTHPNYAGEWVFWLGTWIAGGAARNWPEAIMSLIGLIFVTVVLTGATRALEQKQRNKYGTEYAAFRERTTIWGPKLWFPKTVWSINSTAVVLDGNETELDNVASPEAM